MYRFNYNAYTVDGEVVKAVCVCKSEKDFFDYTREKKLLISKYKKKEIKLKNKQICIKELVRLSDSLSKILKSGIPIIQSIQLYISESNNKRVKDILNLLKVEMLSGESMSQSLLKMSIKFPNMFTSMISVGENCGDLDNIFDSLNYYYSNIDNLRKELLRSITYPIITTLMTLCVYISIKIYFVPKIYSEMQTTIPIENNSDGAKWCDNWIAIVMIIAITIIGALIKKHSDNSIIKKINIFNNIRRKYFAYKFFFSFHMMISNGIDIINALKIIESCETNKRTIEIVKTIINDLLNGNSLTKSLEKSKIFKNSYLTTIAIGEETGTLEKSTEMIYKENYDELLSIFKKIVSLIEPALIIIIGFIVCRLFMSVIGPLMSDYESLL
ncbi:type II secretion system F family protein [Clostridium sp. DL1XJH146]